MIFSDNLSNDCLNYKLSSRNLLIDFLPYSLYDVLVVLDDPVLLFNLPLESHPQVLDSGRDLHFLAPNHDILVLFIELHL